MENNNAVCAVIRDDDKILSVSRKYDLTDFNLPGGKVDSGETEYEAIIREVKEETGLDFFNIQKVFERVARTRMTSCWIGDWSGLIQSSEEGVVKWLSPAELVVGTYADYNKNLFDTLGINYV